MCLSTEEAEERLQVRGETGQNNETKKKKKGKFNREYTWRCMWIHRSISVNGCLRLRVQFPATLPPLPQKRFTSVPILDV
jgi:hypothetical protein